MSSAAGGQRHPRGQAGRISSCGGSAFTGPFGVCYQGSLKLPAQQPHNLIASASPKSCCCSCALTRDSLAARLPRWSATVLHGLRAGLRRLHAVPLQEVMVLMTSYINLLFGSKPRTLPIRPSMTTTMLIFVIASLLTSDPIIHAPHAVCDAMEENHAGPGRTWSPGRHIIQMQESGHPMILDPVFGAPYWRALRPRIIHHLKAGYLWGPLLAANDGDAVAVPCRSEM